MKNNNLKKTRIKYSLIFTLSVSGGLFAVPFAEYIGNMIKQSNIKQEYGDTYDYYLKTKNGIPLKMPIKNNLLNIAFDNTFDEITKEYCAEAIKKLDVAMGSVDVKLVSQSDANGSAQINLKIVDGINESNSYGKIVGRASLIYNEKTAQINYPVDILIDKNTVNNYWINDDLTATNWSTDSNYMTENIIPEFSAIVQHECCHALGLCDLYEKSYAQKSIMYYAIGDGTQPSITEFDSHNLKYIYDKDYKVNVLTPSTITAVYVPQRHNEEAETL